MAPEEKESLEALQAPPWYVEGQRQVQETLNAYGRRLTALETSGASQGRRWGALFGAVVSILSAVTNPLAGCSDVVRTSTEIESKQESLTK